MQEANLNDRIRKEVEMHGYSPSRRRFLGNAVKYTAGAALGATVLGSLGEYVNAQTTTTTSPLIIPKLSYNPTVDNLFSDYNLQKEMLATDLKPPQSALQTGIGKAAVAADDINKNYVIAHTTMTQESSEHAIIAIDGNPIDNTGVPFNSITPIDQDDFYIQYDLMLSNPTSNQKTANLYKGLDRKWGNAQPLPKGFNWDVRFTKSYFNQEQNQMVFAMQIPNSDSQSSLNNKYGMFFAVWPEGQSDGPQYPDGAALFVPNSYGLFTSEYPVDFFSDLRQALFNLLIATSIPLAVLKWGYHRMENTK